LRFGVDELIAAMNFTRGQAPKEGVAKGAGKAQLMWHVGVQRFKGEQSSPNLERNTRVTGNFQGIGIHLLIRNADSKRSASPKLSHSMSFVYRFYSGFAFNPLDLPEQIPEEHNFERNEFRH
jgi:hypothetical protein